MTLLFLFSAFGYPLDLKIELLEPRDTFYTDVEDIMLRVSVTNISDKPAPVGDAVGEFESGRREVQNGEWKWLELDIYDEKGELVEYQVCLEVLMAPGSEKKKRFSKDTLAPGETRFFYLSFTQGGCGYMLYKHPGWCTIKGARFNTLEGIVYEDTLNIRLYSKSCYASSSEQFNEALKKALMLPAYFPGATHEEKLEKSRQAANYFIQTYPDHPAIKDLLRGPEGPLATDRELLRQSVLRFPEYCLASGILDGYKKQDEAFYWEIIGELRKMKDRPMLQQILKDKGLLKEDQK